MQDSYIGQVFGNYRLLHSIGNGGSAKVYQGEHVQHPGAFAAVKVLQITLDEERQREDFRREVEHVLALHHPNIVQILEFDMNHVPPFMTMEYMSGSLAKRHPRTNNAVPLPLTTVAEYVRSIAAVLQYAHEHAVTHFDVKPGNMLVGFYGEIKLADFGISRLNRDIYASTMSQIVGTPPYMAPEQIDGHGFSASDQYSLAAVVYEWISGKPVFSGNVEALLYQHQYSKPTPLYHLEHLDISLALSNVVMQALAKEPRQRYGSVSDFASAFIGEVYNQSLHGAQTVAVSLNQSLHSAQTVAASSDQIVENTPLEVNSFGQSQPSYRIIEEHELVREQRTLLQQIHEWNSSIIRDLQTIEEEHTHARGQIATRTQEQLLHLATIKEEILGPNGSVHHLQRGLTQRIKKIQPSLLRRIVLLLRKTSAQALSQPTLEAYHTSIQNVGKHIDTFLHTHLSKTFLFLYLLFVLVVGGSTALIARSIDRLFQVTPPATANSTLVLWTFIIWLLCTLSIVVYLLFRFIGKPFRSAVATLDGMHSAVEDTYQWQRQRVEEEREQNYQAAETTYRERYAQKVLNLQHEWAGLHATIEKHLHKMQHLCVHWTDTSWETWQMTQETTQHVAWLGTFTVSLGGKIREVLNFPGDITLPALITYRPGFVMSIEARVQPTVKAQIVEGIEALILRILTAQPARAVHFTILDPSQWTRNLERFSPYTLQDTDNIVGISRVWSLQIDIQQQLGQLIDYIKASATRSTYALSDKGISHVLIILDFSESFFDIELRREVLDIVRNGPEYGVSTILVNDFQKPLPTEFEHSLQEWRTAVITSRQQDFTWHDRDYQDYQFRFNNLEHLFQDKLEHILAPINNAVRPATSLEYNQWFNEQLRAKGSLPVNAETGTQLFLGHAAARQMPLTAAPYGKVTNNLLIVRQDGQKKYTLSMFTNIMIGLIAQYPKQTSARFFGLDLSGSIVEAYNGTHPFELVQQLFATRGYIKHAGDSVSVNTATKLVQFYNALNDTWEDAWENATANNIPTYIFVYDLPKLNSFSLKKATSQQKDVIEKIRILLRIIVEDGNKVNMYVIMAHDLFFDSQAVLGDDTIPFFGQRVVSGAISSQFARDVLWRDTIPPNLEEGQAYLYSTTSSSAALERFYPYDFPSREWLEWVAKHI